MVTAGEKLVGGPTPDFVPAMRSSRCGLEMLGIRHGSLEIGELEPERETRPARSLEGRGARYRLIEQIEDGREWFRSPPTPEGGPAPRVARTTSLGRLFQREDRSLGVAGRGEQLTGRESPLRQAASLRAASERAASERSPVTRSMSASRRARSASRGDRSSRATYAFARYLEIAAGEAPIRGLGEPCELELADGVRCEHRR